MADHTLHYGESDDGTEFLLTTWDDGTREVAVRTGGMGTWGPPVELTPQPAEVTC